MLSLPRTSSGLALNCADQCIFKQDSRQIFASWARIRQAYRAVRSLPNVLHMCPFLCGTFAKIFVLTDESRYLFHKSFVIKQTFWNSLILKIKNGGWVPMIWTVIRIIRILARTFRSIPHRIHGIYANIWGILMVNVTIYSIHGSYGYTHYTVCILQGSWWDVPLRYWPSSWQLEAICKIFARHELYIISSGG